jgi:hypothetical protein
MNGITVEIGGKQHVMRWEVAPVHEFETLHPELGGAARAWNNSIVNLDALFALWAMCLRCSGTKMTDADAMVLLQTYLDEGHDIEDAYDLVGEAGIEGKFYKRIEPDDEAEVEASPLTPEDGTTKPAS